MASKKINKSALVRSLIAQGMDYNKIAARVKLPVNRIYTINWLDKQRKLKKSKPKKVQKLEALSKALAHSLDTPPPTHAMTNGNATLAYIDTQNYNFNIGSAIEAIAAQGFEAAKAYLDREIARRQVR